MSEYLDPAPILALQHDQTDGAFARRIGVTRETILRWRRANGLLYRTTAEQVAMRLDRHPLDLWPDIAVGVGDWREKARCKGTAGLYHLAEHPTPTEAKEMGWKKAQAQRASATERKAKARKMCAECPVKLHCLDWVLRNVADSVDVGIWAGTTKNQRKRMRHALQTKVA